MNTRACRANAGGATSRNVTTNGETGIVSTGAVVDSSEGRRSPGGDAASAPDSVASPPGFSDLWTAEIRGIVRKKPA